MSERPPAIDGFVDLERIGRGGFATVYRARQPSAGRHVALKVLDTELDDEAARRFERECQVLGSLSSHPGICTLYSSGRTDDGHPYLVLELCSGSLADELRNRGPMAPEHALAIVRAVAEALAHAHHRGVLHRDVKPGNVLLSAFGQPVLGDFGIARVQEGWRTESGFVTASLNHAAPEVLDGESPTVRSDVWSLASTTYELVTGASPFRQHTGESSAQVLARIFRDPPPDLRPFGVAPEVVAVLERAMSKDPADRTPSMEALIADLERVHGRFAPAAIPDVTTRRLGGTPDTTPTAPIAEPTVAGPVPTELAGEAPARPHGSRRATLVGAVGLLAVAVIAAVVVAGARGSGGTSDGIGRISFSAAPNGSRVLQVDETASGTKTTVAALSCGDAFGTLRRDGEQLLRGTEQCGVQRIDPATGDVLATLDPAGRCDEGCDWSPDGRRVAYTRPANGARDVVIAELDARGSVATRHVIGTGGSPRFSDDGTKLVWEPYEESYKLYDVTTGDVHTVPANGSRSHPSLDRHAERIAADLSAPDSTGAGLVVVDVSDASERRVCTEVTDGNHPAWSPDGRSLVFTTGAGAVRICDVDHGTVTDLEGPIGATWAAWR